MVIPGRWWGKVNGKALPLAECQQEELPNRAAVYANRVARKLRQKLADEAKHQCTARDLGAMDFDKKPYLSQFGMIRMKGGHLSEHGQLHWQAMQIMANENGKRWGKFRHRRKKRKDQEVRDVQRILAAKYAGVGLISALSPQSALRIMQYATERFKDWQENHPVLTTQEFERQRSPTAAGNGLWRQVQRPTNPTHPNTKHGAAVRCICSTS